MSVAQATHDVRVGVVPFGRLRETPPVLPLLGDPGWQQESTRSVDAAASQLAATTHDLLERALCGGDAVAKVAARRACRVCDADR